MITISVALIHLELLQTLAERGKEAHFELQWKTMMEGKKVMKSLHGTIHDASSNIFSNQLGHLYRHTVT